MIRGQGQPARIKQPDRRRASILIVDDDPLVLDLLGEFLGRSEFAIATALSGEEALSRIRAMPIDVALVDFKMPGMDGLETIEKISDINPETVSVLMTGFPTIDSSIKAIRLGASDYLLKPFKLEEVNLAVGRAVKERELRREMKSLRRRVAEFEKGTDGKRDNIKINEKLDLKSPSFFPAVRSLHDPNSQKRH
jgi:DNA-binding NtrC family response regulator